MTRRLFRPTPFDSAASQLGYIPVEATTTAVTGTVAVTESNDTSIVSGVVIITGSSAQTEANDACVASGTLTIIGAVTVMEGGDNCVANGTGGQEQISVDVGGGYKKLKEIKAKAESPKWKKKREEERELTEKLEMLYERFANGYVPETKVAKIAEKYIERPISETYKIVPDDINYLGIITNLRDLNVLINEYDKIKYLQDEEVLLLLVA